jgi:apolipoprotein N-acyltransferase
MGQDTKRRLCLSLTSGLLLGVPWSVPSLFFLIFVAWVPLLALEAQSRDDPNPYLLFNYAFLSFLVWNILGTWWIARAQWLGAILIMVANALVQALVFWSVSRIRKHLHLPLIIPFLIVWMGYEHFHEIWDLAWPWLNLGNALNTAPKLIQWVEYTGVRGGTLWIILTNVAVFKLVDSYLKRKWRAIFPMGGVIVVLIFIPVWVSYHLFDTFKDEGEPVTVALIQPNLDPYTEKFVPQRYSRHLDAFFKTADALCDETTDFLFGPETLIVRQIDEDHPEASPEYRRLLHFQARYPKLNILIGVHSYQKTGEPAPPGSRFNREEGFFYEAFNTALFLAPGTPPQFYHKTKLVPLFERVPFVQYLGFLRDVSLELGGYTGTYSDRQADHVFVSHHPRAAILPIVCFESAFGPYCSRYLPEERGFIAMITNDGWWKDTPGYLHHFRFSPVRAIECRRDLVRVANTGISALINARGMVMARTPWWEKASFKGRIHLRRGRTFFARHGDYLGRISLILGLLLILMGEIFHRMHKRQRTN